MSVTLDLRVIDPGDDAYVSAAWQLKERIRDRENVLKQRKGFFFDAYRRSTVYALIEPGQDDTLIGFAAVRRDGYILFLAIDPNYRNHGFGRQLIQSVAENHSSVSCHARTSNTSALGFYEHLGFEIKRRVAGYYEDGGDAFYLHLGENGLASKLSRIVRGE